MDAATTRGFGLLPILVLSTGVASSALAADLVYVLPIDGNSWVTQGVNGYDAEIGRWDIPYPYGYDCDNPWLPGNEPIGVSRVVAAIDVQDGGILSFDWVFRTYDNLEPAGDWIDLYVQDADVTTYQRHHFGNAAPCPGAYWETGRSQFTLNLAPWRNKTVSFIIDVMQDGHGEQTQASVWNMEIRNCPIAPLTPLSDDSLTQYLETHGGVDTTRVTQAIKSALECLIAAVRDAGGDVVVTGGFRTQEYQLHLREVWTKDRLLRRTDDPACDDLRAAVAIEIARHRFGNLQTAPAGSAGLHTQGLALDLTFAGPVNGPALAEGCGLCRPIPEVDAPHYILCGGGQ
jgi:hypothetical protein